MPPPSTRRILWAAARPGDRVLRQTRLRFEIPVETFSSTQALLGAIQSMSGAELRGVGGLVFPFPAQRGGAIGFEQAINLAEQVARMLRAKRSTATRILFRDSPSEALLLARATSKTLHLEPREPGKDSLKATIEALALVPEAKPLPQKPLIRPCGKAQYERMLLSALSSQNPARSLMRSLVGAEGLLPICRPENLAALAERTGHGPGGIKRMLSARQMIDLPTADALLMATAVPDRLREEYREVLVGIPSPAKLVRRLAEKDPNPFRDVRPIYFTEEVRGVLADPSKPSVGQVAALFRIAQGWSQEALGLSPMTVGAFEHGKTRLEHETAQRYCELMGLKGEDARAFMLPAMGCQYRSPSALFERLTSMQDGEKSVVLQLLFDQTGLRGDELARHLGVCARTVLYRWIEQGRVSILGVGEKLAPLLGLAEKAEVLAERFETRLGPWSQPPFQRTPDGVVLGVIRGKIEPDEAMLTLFQLTRKMQKTLLAQLGLPKTLLNREGFSRRPEVTSALPQLVDALAAIYPSIVPYLFLERLRVIFDASLDEFAGSFESRRKMHVGRAESLARRALVELPGGTQQVADLVKAVTTAPKPRWARPKNTPRFE